MGGSNIEMVTKAGGRQFHGEGSYFMRREWLNANSFFNNRNGVIRPALRRHQFGGSFGGPLPFFNFGDGGGPLSLRSAHRRAAERGNRNETSCAWRPS